MSSPSRSKSVAITTLSAFFARFLRLRMISFSLGFISMGAYTKYGKASMFQRFRSRPSSKNGRFFLNGGLGKRAGMFALMASPSAEMPCQPRRFVHASDSGKSDSRMWPRKPMATHSSPFTVKRNMGVENTLSALGELVPRSVAICFAASFFSVTTSFMWCSFVSCEHLSARAFTRNPLFINVCGDHLLCVAGLPVSACAVRDCRRLCGAACRFDRQRLCGAACRFDRQRFCGAACRFDRQHF